MFLIYRHLLKSATGPFFFGLFVITFVLIIDTLFRYIDLFVSKGVSFLRATEVFILSLGFYVTPAILGGGKVLMVAEYISVQLLVTLQWGTAATT